MEPSPEHMKFRHAPSSSVGRVGLRCVHCAMARQRRAGDKNHNNNNDEAPMAVFYPKSVNEIYRLVTSWQRCHVRKCKSLPPSVRAVWNELRATEKSRGKTAYWAEAASQIGMVDCPSRAGGIRFDSAAVAASANKDDDKDEDMFDDDCEIMEPVTRATTTTAREFNNQEEDSENTQPNAAKRVGPLTTKATEEMSSSSLLQTKQTIEI